MMGSRFGVEHLVLVLHRSTSRLSPLAFRNNALDIALDDTLILSGEFLFDALLLLAVEFIGIAQNCLAWPILSAKGVIDEAAREHLSFGQVPNFAIIAVDANRSL